MVVAAAQELAGGADNRRRVFHFRILGRIRGQRVVEKHPERLLGLSRFHPKQALDHVLKRLDYQAEHKDYRHKTEHNIEGASKVKHRASIDRLDESLLVRSERDSVSE